MLTRSEHTAQVAEDRRLRRLIKRSLAVLAVLILLMIAILAVTAPLSKSLQPITAPSITLLPAEGKPIARRGAVVEAPVKVADLPAYVPAAFLAIEDRRFYNHAGVDPWGILRAAFVNVGSGEVAEGGSTISQQLAKLSFLSSDQTLVRKAQEFVLAFWLEAWLEKDEILSRYLSGVYFGDNVYGLRAAANHYFSRKPEELTLKQATMLAGLVKAPSKLAPTSNLKGARERGAIVLNAMVEADMVDAVSAGKSPEVVLKIGTVKDLPKGTYFADWVLSKIDEEDARYGEHTIKTTLEDRQQRLAVNAIRGTGTNGSQVALVSMRTDGRVVAMVGGRNYLQSAFNRATQAKRQPGSTFKLFVYLAALRAGMTPASPVSDTPLRIGDWSPQNYEGKYRGRITLREAFAVSSNVAAVRLSQSAGTSSVVQAARDLGVTSDLEETPSLALGTSGVSLIEMVSAFAAIANGRYPIRAKGIPDEAASGATPLGGDHQEMMRELLWAAGNEGTGRAAAIPAGTFGKTGTTQDSRDAYFTGFAGDLVTGVWIGRDDNSSIGDTGGGIPAQIWKSFMAEAVKNAAPASAPPPSTDQSGLTVPATVDQSFGTTSDYYVPDYDVEASPAPLPSADEAASRGAPAEDQEMITSSPTAVEEETIAQDDATIPPGPVPSQPPQPPRSTPPASTPPPEQSRVSLKSMTNH